ALPGQQERVHDAQDGIERIGIDGLLDTSSRGGGIPLGAKISPLHKPAARIPRYPQLFVDGFGARLGQLDLKFEAGVVRGTYIPNIAVLNQADERRVARTQAYGQVA